MTGLLNKMVAWESGLLDEQEELELFQELTQNGTVWHLQGAYGSRAVELMGAGELPVPGGYELCCDGGRLKIKYND